jgi:hypothetical protein
MIAYIEARLKLIEVLQYEILHTECDTLFFNSLSEDSSRNGSYLNAPPLVVKMASSQVL